MDKKTSVDILMGFLILFTVASLVLSVNTFFNPVETRNQFVAPQDVSHGINIHGTLTTGGPTEILLSTQLKGDTHTVHGNAIVNDVTVEDRLTLGNSVFLPGHLEELNRSTEYVSISTLDTLGFKLPSTSGMVILAPTVTSSSFVVKGPNASWFDFSSTKDGLGVIMATLPPGEYGCILNLSVARTNRLLEPFLLLFPSKDPKPFEVTADPDYNRLVTDRKRFENRFSGDVAESRTGHGTGITVSTSGVASVMPHGEGPNKIGWQIFAQLPSSPLHKWNIHAFQLNIFKLS
jgi:hypothetical protein